MRGIAAAGAHVPRYRLPTDAVADAWGTAHARGIDATAVPAPDEDAVTMAVAAAGAALDRWDGDAGTIEFVGVATTTPPLDEEGLVGRTARALGLPTDVEAATNTASTAAGAALLARALSADGPALVAVADCPAGEPADDDHPFGAGAAAFVVASDPVVTIHDSAWHVDEYPGVRYRERGADAVRSLGSAAYERAAVRECVTAAVDRLDVTPGDAAGVALHQPDGATPYRLGGALGVDSAAVDRGTVVDRLGDAGAAGTPLGMLAALEAAGPGDRTLACFFGSGGAAAAFALQGGLDAGLADALAGGVELSYPAYLRRRGYVTSGAVAGGGAHVSLAAWRQTLEARYRLVAGRCPECGALTFPPDGACSGCHARITFEPVDLPRTGTIEAVTVVGSGGAPPEFAEYEQRAGPYAVAVVRLEAAGAAVTLPAQIVGTDPEAATVGDPVEAVIRRLYVQEGLPRYGLKFAPVG